MAKKSQAKKTAKKVISAEKDSELTPRQAEILAYIKKQALAGEVPTIRELCEEHKISSPNGIMCHLNSLVAKGHITMEGSVSRGIRLCRQHSASSVAMSDDEFIDLLEMSSAAGCRGVVKSKDGRTIEIVRSNGKGGDTLVATIQFPK